MTALPDLVMEKDEPGDAPRVSNPIPMMIGWSDLQF
jgi:hypothetical protein